MRNRTLILTAGLPRSGKSTWAQKQGHPIVCPDAIRLALHGQAYRQESEPMVWAMAQMMVRALFAAGHTKVIVDATNITRERRAIWVSEEEWRTEVMVFTTDAQTCVERARRTDREYLVPVIDSMSTKWERVLPEENIEEVIIIPRTQ